MTCALGVDFENVPRDEERHRLAFDEVAFDRVARPALEDRVPHLGKREETLPRAGAGDRREVLPDKTAADALQGILRNGAAAEELDVGDDEYPRPEHDACGRRDDGCGERKPLHGDSRSG